MEKKRKTQPVISVVIPTLNEGKAIGKCLGALKKQSFKEFEVLVVDSGSKDGTVEKAKALGARVVFEPRRGAGLARNTGAGKARGKIIAFTDADTIVPRDWLARINAIFSDARVVAAGGIVEPLESGLKHKVAFFLFNNIFPRAAKALGFNAFHGSNLAVRKSAFLAAGGFDEAITAIEDNELPNRLRSLGRVVFDPSLRASSSARRFEKMGYVREMLRYWKAYYTVYLSRKPYTEKYPLVH